MELIRLDHVTYQYDEASAPAVNDVDFSIEKGGFVGIIGENGSGKSTLAKLLNGLYQPTAGHVYVDGLDTASDEDLYEVRKRCGMIFQNPDNQLVATEVRDDVAFGLENLGVPPREMPQRINAALEAVGMREEASKAPHLLSGGQKQRVAIAGVLAMRPQAIVCDEATAMLDPKGRREVMDVMQRLNREEGITVLWITHFMEEAAMCRELYVMHEGKTVMHGTPREIFSQSEKLWEYSLEEPCIASLCRQLREAGIPFPMCLTADEMAEEAAKRCS
ncbi:MAG: energy-coupling factor transporter ATPase [Clostridia bacterium]|nr:energy-coupling factor transporter ATPase [Clostridia bacterium]